MKFTKFKTEYIAVLPYMMVGKWWLEIGWLNFAVLASIERSHEEK